MIMKLIVVFVSVVLSFWSQNRSAILVLISVESNTIRAAVRWPSQLRPFRIVGVAVTCPSLCVLLGILLFQRKRLDKYSIYITIV